MASTPAAQRDVAGARDDRGRATDAGAVTLTMTAATADAPAGGTGATAGAYDSAANRDTAIALINNNKDRLAEAVADIAAIDARVDAIVTALQRAGLLA